MTMQTWSNRLAVSYKEATSNKTEITPIDSFSPTFAMPVEVVHSIERTHAAVIRQPRNITFTFTAKALGGAVANLTRLAAAGTTFDIIMEEKGENGPQWSFRSIVLSQCIITSCQPTTATPTGVPTAVFSGVSLSATAADNVTGAETKLP